MGCSETWAGPTGGNLAGDAAPLFSATGVCVDLAGETGVRRIVDRATFCLDTGEIVDLVGRSGSGKSTLIRACARMVEPAAGSLALRGCDCRAVSPQRWRASVCLVAQKPALVAGTVRDNLLLPWTLGVRRGCTPPADEEMAHLLCLCAMGEVGLSRDASRLSGGQAARVSLLRCLLCKPEVLLLDEVDAALDDGSARAVGALVRRAAAGGAAVLRIRHRSEDGLASRVLTMEEGRLVP